MSSRSDTCDCRPCTYPNGAVVLVISQILLFIGFILSAVAAADCQFVTVPAGSVDGELSRIYGSTVRADDTKRGLGFFFFEDTNGECTWDRHHHDDTLDEYWDYLGHSDWEDAARAAVAATWISFLFFIWVMVFSCAAQPKILRYLGAALLIILLTVLQSVPFMVVDSDFCNKHDCSLGRSAGYAIAAVVLFFVAGVLLFFTRDYPGRDRVEPQPLVLAPAPVLAPADDHTSKSSGDENATADHTINDEENPQQLTDRALPEEVPVQDDMVDVSLVDSQATTVKARPY